MGNRQGSRVGKYRTTHGLTFKHRSEFLIWCDIRKRCRNPRFKFFSYYGGRGIKVCARWDSFANFFLDMGPRPTPKHEIDRINNDGDYEPNNCRWATRREQMRNTRSVHLLTHDGVSRPIVEWSELLGIRAGTILMRLRRGKSTEEALRT